mmetsp:Transcript_42668/g.117723  ORF Transcript_42668/g.117723 Transcript_42668/m.117723 type:complete len:689 (+) Transcript_42668:111-2177(+)
MAQPQQTAMKASQPNEAPVQKQEETKALHDYFRWRPLPWWVCFLGGIFLLTKLQVVYNDSPCAVLGTGGHVDANDVKRAFRTLSMCTHPDRLRGRLKRQPTPAEERRGSIIFNRASAAKDTIAKAIKKSRKNKIACYEGELELAVFEVLSQVGRLLSTVGVWDYLKLATDSLWSICTFEAGFIQTPLLIMWLFFLFRIVKQFVSYLWRMGLLRGFLALVTTTVIGPLPTLINFVSLPVLRLLGFLKKSSSVGLLSESDSAAAQASAPASPPASAPTTAPASGSEEKSDDPVPQSTMPSSASLAAAKESRSVPRNVRQRKGKEADEEKEKRNSALLAGTIPQATVGAMGVVDPTYGAGPMPEGIWSCVSWSHKEPVKARQAAASAVQFDLLLILTKPIIPLFMLVLSGQVWNGLFISFVIGHVLRKWVPQMSYEAQHLLCSFFGAVHTLLGVSASQVENYASKEGQSVLNLAWSWSFKDVLCVMHMCLLGSTVTAVSALGNEPSYAASFASGIALRIALAQDSVRGLGPVKLLGQNLEVLLRNSGISLDATEEVVAYSGNGIGDCGGGPFRMLFGDGDGALWASRSLKAWLMLMPLLAMLHWGWRAALVGKMIRKRWKLARFVQRIILFLLGLLQCWMLVNMELNASNGALVNFWLAMLFGCVGESLLSTFDIRGSVRQIVFLLIFLLV